MLFEITKRFFEIGVQLLVAHPARDAAARAIPTVTRTTIRHEKEDAIRISMDQSRYRHVRILAAGIGHIIGRGPCLLDPRNDLTPDRAIRIFAFDQVEKMRRDGEGKLRT